MPPKSGADDAVPNTFVDEGVDNSLNSNEVPQIFETAEVPADGKQVIKRRIVWPNVVWYLFLHMGALYGFYVATTKAMWTTLLWSM